MKMVVAYIDGDRFETIRETLLGLGFASISAWEAAGTIPEPVVLGSYRGVAVANHLRPKTRLECVVGDDHSATVVETVLELGGERTFVVVLGVETAYPTMTVKADAGAPVAS